jgi:hypothetical protein
MNNPSLRRSAIIFAANLLIQTVIFFGQVLGSGILPIAFNRLLLVATFISILIALLSCFIRRWTIAVAVALSFCGFFVSGAIFDHYVENGLERAKAYGGALASEVEAIHKRTGNWPASLEEIPAEHRPKVDLRKEWPYLYIEEDGFYSKVGGFVVWYSADDQVPDLSVGRREISYTWNWQKSGWEESRRR